MVGQKFQEWDVVKCIGEGSYGKVYKIVREEFGHTYEAALKIIDVPQHPSEVQAVRSEGMTDENVTLFFQQMVERIVDEFALMAKLKGNSNIVSYEDHVVEKKENEFGWRIFIRMELLTPLLDHIKSNGLSEKDIVKLGIDLCRGLELCKNNSIIHRDIKPENIFISPNGDYKIGDFGIARELEKTSAMFTKVGTRNYMAPEVFKGEEYNSSVDIYSLGIVMYRYLNENRHPFWPPAPQNIQFSDQENATVRRMRGDAIPAPSKASESLSQIVLKACSYRSEDRYSDPSHMRAELELIYNDARDDIILRIENKKSGTRSMSVEPVINDDMLTNDNGAKLDNSVNNITNEPFVSGCVSSNGNSASGASVQSKEKRKKGIGVYLVLCVLVGALFGGGIFYYNKNYVTTKDVASSVASITTEDQTTTEVTTEIATTELAKLTMPDLKGMAEEEYSLKLSEANLIVGDIEEKYSSKAKKGSVISQKPAAGEDVCEGDKVNIIISKGVEKVTVPNVIGLTADKAQSSLKKVGLKLELKYEYDTTVSAGNIFKQSVDADKKVTKGKKITIYVSNGPKPAPVVSTPKQSTTKKTNTPKKKKSKKNRYDEVTID